MSLPKTNCDNEVSDPDEFQSATVATAQSARVGRRWIPRLAGGVLVVAVLAGSMVVASGAAHGHATDAAGPSAAASPGNSGAHCTTKVIHTNRKWEADDWEVGMSCTGNTGDRVVFVRGTLDVPGAFDRHTSWVEILAHTPVIHPPRQVLSVPATSPWGNPTARVDYFKCPPVSIGECRPDNVYNQLILAFASLLTGLF